MISIPTLLVDNMETVVLYVCSLIYLPPVMINVVLDPAGARARARVPPQKQMG